MVINLRSAQLFRRERCFIFNLLSNTFQYTCTSGSKTSNSQSISESAANSIALEYLRQSGLRLVLLGCLVSKRNVDKGSLYCFDKGTYKYFVVKSWLYGVLQFGALDSALGLSEVNLLPEFSFQLSKQIYYDPFS